MARRFVLLDRDGTIIEEKHYLSDPEQVRLIPGVADGLRQLTEMDLGLVVITNQSGVGRGLFGEDQVERVHERMRELLGEENVRLEGIYFCPHAPEEGCTCRKPATGLVEQAVLDLGFDPRDSFVVGDKACDVELGLRLGATTFLVRTGYGMQEEMEEAAVAEFVVDGVWEVASLIESIQDSG